MKEEPQKKESQELERMQMGPIELYRKHSTSRLHIA